MLLAMGYEVKYIITFIIINIIILLYILSLRKTIRNNSIIIKTERQQILLLENYREEVIKMIQKLYISPDNKKIQDLNFISTLDIQAHQALYIMKNFFRDQDKAYAWFNSPNSLLGDLTPNDLYKSGRSQKLLDFVKLTLN